MSVIVLSRPTISQPKDSNVVGFLVSAGRRRIILRINFTIRVLLYAAWLVAASLLAHSGSLALLGPDSVFESTLLGALIFALPAFWLIRRLALRTATPLRDELEAGLREAEIMSSTLVASGRLATIGQLSTGIMHELNNPLTYVRANLGQLREDWGALQKGLGDLPTSDESLELNAEVEELIDESIEGVERLITLVRDATGFAHPGFARNEDVELGALLEGVVRVAATQLPPGSRVERDFPEEVWVSGLPQELKQVFLNLVVNAIHAASEHGTIRVSTLNTSGGATVSIEDDGCGIAFDSIEKLFDPFYTTKPVGKGTGLGLAIAREIIERHGGEIRVRSELNRGTCVTVFLPTRT